MCILQADAFNVTSLMSQKDAKILATVLSKIPVKDLIDLGVASGFKGYDTVGAAYDFVSNVTAVLELLEKLRMKHEMQEHSDDIPHGMVQ